MGEPSVATKVRDSGVWPLIKKRWRAWLRSFHRDFGYLAIGFTVIYAISGIAQNHIEDWGDVSYVTFERTLTLAAIPDTVPDDAAISQVAIAAKLGTPISKLRAGDEIRLEYANGAKATLIGTQLTIQGRERRAFIGAANWIHTARNRKGWKYVADVYALLLLYLAISGIFMIKGKLGLKWRGAVLISAGFAVPIAAVMFSSPQPKKADPASIAAPAEDNGIKFLPPEENDDEPAPVKTEQPSKPADPKAEGEVIERPAIRKPPPAAN